MSRSINKRLAAQQDLLEHFVYLGRQSLDLADRFLEATEQTFRQLADTAGLGSPWEFAGPRFSELRFWPVKHFPNHFVFFYESAAEIEVVRVLHGAQDLARIFQ